MKTNVNVKETVKETAKKTVKETKTAWKPYGSYTHFYDIVKNKIRIAERPKEESGDVKIVINLKKCETFNQYGLGVQLSPNRAVVDILFKIYVGLGYDVVKNDIMQPRIEGETKMVLLINKGQGNGFDKSVFNELISWLSSQTIISNVTMFIKNDYIMKWCPKFWELKLFDD